MAPTEFNHLLNSIKALSPGQMRRLRQQIDSELAQAGPGGGAQPKKAPAHTRGAKDKRTKGALQKRKRALTQAEFDQHLLNVGLITSLPNPSLDVDDDDPEDAPVTIKGEPLSETIIRERR
jgi:hypothetical protein